MQVFWLEANAWDTDAEADVVVRACSADLEPIVSFDDDEWLPVMGGGPIFDTAVFNGTFTGSSESTRGSLAFSTSVGEIDEWARYGWAARSVKIWTAAINADNPLAPVFPVSRELIFDGEAESFDPDEATMLLTTKKPIGTVASDPYLGTGGLEGPASLKDVVKPFAVGEHVNRAPTLVDATKMMFQVHGYGAIDQLLAVRERGMVLDQTFVFHASSAALIAATVPATQIHVHLGSGSFRLGFTPAGNITADFIGHKFPSSSAALTLAAIVKTLLLASGWDEANIDAASFAYVDSELPYTATYHDEAGEDVLTAISSLMAGAGGYWDVDELGVFYIGLFGMIGTADLSVGDEGLAEYDLAEIDHVPVRAPFWRTRVAYARNPTVMNFSDTEAAVSQELLDQITALQADVDGKIDIYYQGSAPAGANSDDQWFDTDDGKTYRWVIGSGWVLMQDSAIAAAAAAAAGAQSTADGKITTFYQSGTPTTTKVGDLWVNTGETPRQVRSWSGSAWVVVSSVGATAGGNLYRADGTTVMTQGEVRTPEGTAAAIAGQGALATQNTADWRTQIASRPAIAELYYDMNYASIAEMTTAGWVLPGGSNVSLAAHNSSPGGKVLVVGTGTGGTAGSLSVFGPEWVPYNAGDLYEVAFDIEVISAEAGSFYYLGVEGQDRAGNILGASHNYVAASSISQPSKVGQRFIVKGYFTGFTAAFGSGQSNDPLAPAALPNGAAAGFGQGGVSRFRPMVLTNYNNLKGQVYVHAVRVTRLPARLAAQSEVAFGTVAITETAGGALASLANFKTGLGTAAAIAGQGALATSNAANWQTQVLGVGKPSNNAGVARILTAVGTGELVGNTLKKTTSSHGVHEGGAIGAIQKNTCFVSSGLLAELTNAGGWVTTLALDLGTGTVNPNSLVDGSFFCTYTANDPNGLLVIYKRISGTTVALGSYTVPGLTALDRRMALIFNGRRVFVMINGTQYGGDNANFNAPPGTSFYPRVFDYHRTDFQSRTLGIEDIQYGEWNDVRVHLDDGYSILDQAGFRTVEGTAAAITGQGPGATAPAQDVLNYIDTTGGGNGLTVIRSPVGGQYAFDNVAGGLLRITLPVGYTSTMIRFAVDLYDYATGTMQTYIISGYTYSSGGWLNVSAQFIGAETSSKRVRFGNDGTKACITIGETGSTWNYPKIFIRDVMVGYTNQAASIWKTGWGISIGAGALPTVDTQIDKPRAGDTVLGESIFESAAGAIATLANFKTILGTAVAIIGQGTGATSNSLSELDAAAAATLAGLTANGAVTVGESQIIKKNIPAGGSVTFNGRVGIAAGGGSGTLAARIQVSLSGSFSWSTVNTSGTVPIGPGEPGSVTVTGTFTNTSGAAALYDFRIAEVVSPGGSGGGIVPHQTYLTG